MMRQSSALLFAMPLTVVLLFLNGNAFADGNTIVATGVDWSRGESICIRENGNDVQQYFAGVVFISLYDQAGDQWKRDTLCVDLFTDIYIGTTYGTTVLDPYGVSGKDLPRVSWLVDNALTNSYLSVLPSTDWVTNSAQGAGIQLAIWDIVHDNGDGFSAGSVQASGAVNNPTPPDVLAWANTYETLSLNQSSDLAYVYDNVNLSTGAAVQMLAGPEFLDNGPAPEPNPVPAPEPSTCQFLLISLAGAMGLRFRRRR
jgi:hypothetical protein